MLVALVLLDGIHRRAGRASAHSTGAGFLRPSRVLPAVGRLRQATPCDPF